MKLTELVEDSDVLGRECRVCIALTELDNVRSNALVAVLSNPKKPYKLIAESLNEEGYPTITGDMVGKHARGQCKAHYRYR